MNEEDVKKINIIDDETKSVLSELLDVSKDIRSVILKEIKKQKQIVKNFDTNKEEYIQAIDELAELDKNTIAEQKKKYQEALEKIKGQING